jgi:protein-S-isoprenylcysteine O-methyltransferase Ste14
MASRDAAGNNAGVNGRYSFAERGGWWVVAQIPLLLAVFFLAPYTSRAGEGFAHPLQYLGVLAIAAGIGAIVAAFVSLGASLTPYPRPRGDATLVTQGVYRFMRHPIYSGLIVGALGWALVWLSLWGLFGAGFVAVFFDRKAAREERWLIERYPDYAAYARRVRRFLPGIY